MLLFNRSQDWLLDKSGVNIDVVDDVNNSIIQKFNEQCGFPPHYSQINTIFAIINTGNPYAILKNPQTPIISKASISHIQTTIHGRNKLMVAKNGKNVNIFLNKPTETAYINIAIECSIDIISNDIKADLIKYILLSDFVHTIMVPDDILKVITINFIQLHLKK